MGTLAAKPIDVNSFKKLGVYSRHGRRAVHKPLLVLLLLADIQRGGSGEVRFKEIESKLTSLIDQFSAPEGTSAKAHYPFWYLQNDGIWTLSDREKLYPRTGKKKGGEPPISLMREVNPLGAMPSELVLKLRDPNVFEKAVRDVLASGFASELQQDVLNAVGLHMKA